MTTDLFDDAGETPQDDSTDSGSPADLLGTLVGEGKPFKTPSDLAKGKLEADKFIEQLKKENAEMREALKGAERNRGAEDLVETLMARIKEASGSEDGNQPGIRPEDISKLVQSELEKVETTRERKANRMRANSVILKHVGGDEAKAKALIATKAREFGLSNERLRDMAESAPLAFASLMGVQERGSTQSPSPGSFSSRNTEADPPSETRNWAFYQKLRKELGSRYYEPHIQQQLFKDRERLGEKFY